MKIETVDIRDIVEYENNAKLHPQEQVEQIKNSILQFGFNDPIAIDENNVIIEGHGRFEAIKQLGHTTVDCIRLGHLDDEQKRAYILAHNKLTMNTDFDLDLLQSELDSILDIDMSDFGFDISFDTDEHNKEESVYTKKVQVPTYELTGDNPELNELVSTDKTDELLNAIKQSNVPDEIKQFLILGAYRHVTFNYEKIAEYYAHAPKNVQELMEQSALVIIDFDKAIEHGYVRLNDVVRGMIDDE